MANYLDRAEGRVAFGSDPAGYRTARPVSRWSGLVVPMILDQIGCIAAHIGSTWSGRMRRGLIQQRFA
jgi:hypothetical protein